MLQRDSLAMTRCTHLLHHVLYLTGTLLTLLVDVVRFLRLCLRLAPVLAAENLFLHKQLALYQERQARPKRANAATRMLPLLIEMRMGRAHRLGGDLQQAVERPI